jgi:Flp pilus assembly pilin Flp
MNERELQMSKSLARIVKEDAGLSTAEYAVLVRCSVAASGCV